MKKKEYISPDTRCIGFTVPESICGSKPSTGEGWSTESEYDLFN